jgi:hypothetical protein
VTSTLLEGLQNWNLGSEIVRELLWKNQTQENGNTMEYNIVQQCVLSQLPVRDSNGKLVVEEELKVSM